MYHLCSKSAHVKTRKYSLTATDKVSRNKKSSRSPSAPPPAEPDHRLTLTEKARREAIMSFGGNTLDNVLEGSTKKVARTLTSSRPSERKDVETEMAQELESESHDSESDDRKEKENLNGVETPTDTV